MTSWKALAKPDGLYLGEADFKSLDEIKTVTIASHNIEDVQNESGKRKKGVLRFKGGVKPLVLNVTNSKTIAKLYGRDADGWIGKQISLYFDPDVRFGKEKVGGVRVKPTVVADKVITCTKCGQPIAPVGNMSAEQTAAYTAKKYGQALCGGCATQAAKALQEAQGGSQDATDE